MPKTNPLPILPQPWQLPYLARGEATLIIVPAKRLATTGPVFTMGAGTGVPMFQRGAVKRFEDCPYQVGAELYAQEEWAEDFLEGVGLVSKSRHWVESALKPSEIGFVEWQPANAMPIEAARIWFRTQSIACIQFGQLTGDDERAMGWNNEAPMPAFIGDDDWGWAVGVKTIAPSFT
jgi:hypothetical protein